MFVKVVLKECKSTWQVHFLKALFLSKKSFRFFFVYSFCGKETSKAVFNLSVFIGDYGR